MIASTTEEHSVQKQRYSELFAICDEMRELVKRFEIVATAMMVDEVEQQLVRDRGGRPLQY